MANQCELLISLLRDEGVDVELVRTNAPYRPAWIESVPVLRAACRLPPYLRRLWLAAGRAQVMHVFANSGWAWHLFAAPAVWIGLARRIGVVVNYRGGLADAFLSRAPSHVRITMRRASARVTPSAFLLRVFRQHGLDAEVIPNIIDLSRFAPGECRTFGLAPRLLVARNLEPIYDIPTAIRALAIVRQTFAQASLTVAGSGVELERLRALTHELRLGDAVRFTGRVDIARMPQLYAHADVALNPSTADNMPNSVLEAFASGVPVVSTDAGGVPDIIEHGRTGLLVPVGDASAMAQAICRLLGDPALSERITKAARGETERCSWSHVRAQWFSVYMRAAAQARGVDG
jgi:glycosyltransferase involved in cell wall biosynthesis